MNPLVTITDTSNCYVDGVNVGQPADAIANNPDLATPIQQALVAFVAQQAQAAQDATAALAAKEQELAAALARIAALTPKTEQPGA